MTTIRVNRVWVFLLTVAVSALGFGSGASAGGWAVSTLDEVPVPNVGTPLDVGFTIRQHGVTPVDLEDVGITITPVGGSPQFFSAAGDGTVGHYVARVEFPSVGQYQWSIRQGGFGDQDLGLIDVGAATTVVNTGGSSGNLRYIAFGGAMLCGFIATGDAVMSRRRRLSLS
ncbi:MAG: hypothetical protein ABI570_05805 [Ilumatobacteraceae bacterium]